MRIAICDDEKEYLDNMVELLQKWSKESDTDVEILRFCDGDSLISQSKLTKFDIVFLDIVMPLLNGMDTAREIREYDKSVLLIFLTSSPEFALESYEVKAHNYLLKPATYPRLKNVLDECVALFKKEDPFLLLKTSYGFQKVYYNNIEFIEALNKKVIFHLSNNRSLEIIETLKNIESRLIGDKHFFKIHRSYIAYIPNVDHFDNNSVYTKSGAAIPIARGLGKSFQDSYFSVMFDNEK